MGTVQAQETDLASRLAAWTVAQGIAPADSPAALADRVIASLGPAYVAARLGGGSTEYLRATAARYTDPGPLSDARWAAEDYLHGHGGKPPKEGRGMAEKYDPVPDLARLLHAALLGGQAGAAHAERIAERLGLGEDDSAEVMADVLRKALGLKARRCGIDGGPGLVIPPACTVHGIPCEVCGGLEGCTGDCGEVAPVGGLCEAMATPSGTVCREPSAGLYRGACEHGHLRAGRLCAGHAAAALWCRECFELPGAGSHVCEVTPALVAGVIVREVTPDPVARAHPDGYGDTATCKHCRKPVARCAALPGHAGCTSGYGWIHSDPEQWGHSCRPRSGAPYALPSPSTEATQATGTEAGHG